MPEEQKSIPQAIAELGAAIKTRLKREPEYADVYLYQQDQVPDTQHLQRLADKFARRGHQLRWSANLTLLSCLLVIGLGISVFLMPARFTDQGQVQEEVDDTLSEKSSAATEEARLQVDYLKARDLYNLYGLYHEIYLSLKNYQPGVNLQDGSFYQARLRYGVSASEQLASDTPVAQRYSFEMFQYHEDHGVVVIPADAFEIAAKQLENQGVSTGRLASAFERLWDAVNEDLQNESVELLIRELQSLESFYQNAKSVKESLFLAFDADAKKKLESVEQLIEFDRRISDALIRMNQTQSLWANQPWLTLLTVRVGIVILLLYLTNVLLANYRYTQTLSAYYLARADALQMLPRRPTNGEDLFDVADLAQLIPLLSPDQYKIDKESVPYEALGKAAVK